MMNGVSTYAVTIAVITDIQLDDDQARDVAAGWAAAAGLDLGMTSTRRDEPWLRVSAVSARRDDAPAMLARDSTSALLSELSRVEATVAEWLAVEVLHQREIERRGRQPEIPPVVSAPEMAALAGVRVQRIHQLQSQRSAGQHTDFPAPILDGYWLRTAAEHWASTRRRKPRPARKA
jgi:hypothetical protein